MSLLVFEAVVGTVVHIVETVIAVAVVGTSRETDGDGSTSDAEIPSSRYCLLYRFDIATFNRAGKTRSRTGDS
ncbi:hypothetical protein [Natronolimnohabitans innermongolicus]|uniref:Uncharacterized protein n=1 Tax=Natronolimnohabitans innermongolicus JCM 12255 TaxID=1227499 RepID=L9X7K5_9EURY|nr:hypothetical protein [Natronolimnohabitans innermongolicus]ELY57411.1 hypothetical protein C493_07996 [Natronolimnohabitans innermongolicus JCM 12255]